MREFSQLFSGFYLSAVDVVLNQAMSALSSVIQDPSEELFSIPQSIVTVQRASWTVVNKPVRNLPFDDHVTTHIDNGNGSHDGSWRHERKSRGS